MNLVFASGFFVPQHILGIDYFRGLKAHVEGNGHQALFPEVPPLGTCEVRAEVLADAIQRAYPKGPVHIIAHSMGGLDSRTLIARNLDGLSSPGRVASLTTVSSPHRGSPVAEPRAGSHGSRCPCSGGSDWIPVAILRAASIVKNNSMFSQPGI